MNSITPPSTTPQPSQPKTHDAAFFTRIAILSATLFFVMLALISISPSFSHTLFAYIGMSPIQKTHYEIPIPPLSASQIFDMALIASSKTVAPPPLSAESYLIQIIGMENPLLKRLIGRPFSPASITKLFTALIAREIIPTDALITISNGAKRVEEKTSDIEVGETFHRDDLIKLMIVTSANDAAVAIAEAVGAQDGEVAFDERLQFFLDRMQRRAHELGFIQSSFENPTGLDVDPAYRCEEDIHSTTTPINTNIPESNACHLRHAMTAKDLHTLVEYIWRYDPYIFALSRITDDVVTSTQDTPHRITTTNDILRDFPEILGGKTGTTDIAGETLLLLYPFDEQRVATIIILKSHDRFGDARNIIHWLHDVRDAMRSAHTM